MLEEKDMKSKPDKMFRFREDDNGVPCFILQSKDGQNEMKKVCDSHEVTADIHQLRILLPMNGIAKCLDAYMFSPGFEQGRTIMTTLNPIVQMTSAIVF